MPLAAVDGLHATSTANLSSLAVNGRCLCRNVCDESTPALWGQETANNGSLSGPFAFAGCKYTVAWSEGDRRKIASASGTRWLAASTTVARAGGKDFVIGFPGSSNEIRGHSNPTKSSAVIKQ